MTKVSIVIPIFNSEKYMNKCIDSILDQSLKDIEIILVNDGSTDNSAIIADSYKIKDSRVKVIHQKNSGPSVARNNAIKLATGKYIGFVDSDDYIEKDMYKRLFNIASDKNIQISMCGYKEIHLYNDTSIEVKTKLINNKVYYKEDINKEIISTFCKSNNYGFYSLWNKLYLREWLIESEFILDENRDHGEDWWFNINVISKVDSFICTNEPLYNYVHINENSLMFKYRENQFDLLLESRKNLISIIPDEFIDYEELNIRFIYEFSSYILRTFKNVKNKEKCKFMIKNVLTNKDVIEVCNGKYNMSIYFRIIVFLIGKKLYKCAFNVYKYRSLLR